MSYSVEEMTDRIRGAMDPDPQIGKTIKFDLKGDGFIYIDGQTVTNEDRPADLTMTIAKDDLIAMGEGKLDATMAFMSGKLKLSDMGLAMSLQPKMNAMFSRLQ
ncbi:MAG TPA: SCP2 sterol-binding domain-containing protein [Caulobacteraceae bacterium]